MMTKREFINYLESFGKNPGEFADDELIEICWKHKHELRPGDKNWNDLAALVGVAKTGDALRKWADNHYKDIKFHEHDDKEESQFMKLYKAQQMGRDEWTAARRYAREDSRIEAMLDAIRTATDGLNKLPKIKAYKPQRGGKTEAILMLSDLHIGVDCNNYVNIYNTDIAAKRLGILANETIRYCNENDVEILHILNLGDMISGLIHVNARIENSLDVIEQIMTAAELLAKFMNTIAGAAPYIDYRSVVDNHSRATPNKNEHIEKENFNKLIDWYLEERLKDSPIVFEHDNLDDGIGAFKLEKSGKYVVFAHGHQDSPAQGFQHMIGLTKNFVDYVLLAHYHSPKQKEYQETTVIVNGSIVGTEEYAFSKRLFGKPSQKILIFDEGNLMNIDINLSSEVY